ncbi:potassium channel family protein [Stutzerimonas marianensis]|uniref:potassium channel family protein n=1 Tax=Stutzerimonas marianensis TaxID=2929513 RepID=UPI003C304EB0
MLLLLLGVLLFLLVATDITKTTLSTRGGGILTNLVSRLVWWGFFSAARRRGASRLLEYAGQAVLLSVLLTWIVMLWLSLFLVFASTPGSVVDDTTGVAADLWETFYYAGFTLSTLGVGDYAAGGDGWRVLTSAAAFCGLTFITAAITYIVPVLSAVSLQNQLSLFITSMGDTPQAIVVNSWNGEDVSSFYDNATDLRQMLVEHTLNHHAYPVIRCFHNSQAGKNLIPAIALIDETLRLLDRIAPQIPQDRLKRRMLGSALDNYVELHHSAYLRRRQPSMTAPSVRLDSLREAGIPVASPVPSADEAQRRDRLGALLEADGWEWRDVYGDDSAG